MHVHLLAAVALFSSAFWIDLWHQTPTRVIAIATFVSGVTQLVKRAVPNGAIQGRWAVLVNLGLSIVGVFAGMQPANFMSQTTLSQLVVIFIAAGGIHGIAQAFRAPASALPPPQTAPPQQQNSAGLATKAPLVLLIIGCAGYLMFALALTGCAPKQPVMATLPAGAINQVDAQANRALQTVHAFMKNTTADVQAGKIRISAAQLQAIVDVNTALNAADLAEQAYHNSGGTTDATALNNAVSAAQAKFQAAQTALAAGPPK
jgi:hypothetical protein